MPKDNFFIFSLDNFRYALRLALVERVILAAAVTPLPEHAGNILGIINVHGEIMPVINTRKVFGLPVREIIPGDMFIIIRTELRKIILVADSVEQVTGFDPGEMTKASEIIPEYPEIETIARLDNGIILIHDMERCLIGELHASYEWPDTTVTVNAG